MSSTTSIIIKGIQILAPELPKHVQLNNNTMYIYHVVNRYALDFCIFPPRGELYYPSYGQRISKVDNKMFSSLKLCFLDIKGDYINFTCASQWLVSFGFYHANNETKLCLLKCDGKIQGFPEKFSLFDCKTNEVINENIDLDQIFLVESEESMRSLKGIFDNN